VSPPASDRGAYYDYLNYECTIKNNTAEIKIKKKVTIENERGLEYNAIRFYEDSYNKLSDVKIRILDSNGKVVQKYKLADFEKFCGYGSYGILYDDNCRYYKEFSYSHYPYSIEYEYSVLMKSLFYWNGATFQYYIPVNEAIYKLTTPDDFKFKYKIYGTGVTYNSQTVKSKKGFIWTASNIKQIKRYKNRPDGYPEIAHVRMQAEQFEFAGIDFNLLSWRGIGNWYRELASDCYLTPSEIDSTYLNKNVLKENLVEQIFNDVNDATRYVMISIEEGGWKPHRAVNIRELGYGDCKDMSTLLISNLRTAGFHAYPVLALTRGEGKVDKDFPSFKLNHLFTITIANDDTIWLDPTCDLCAYDELRNDDQNIDVLVVTDTGGVMLRTPSALPEDNHFLKETDVLIDGFGKLHITSTLTYTGHYARSLRMRLRGLDTDDRLTLCRNRLAGNDKDFVLKESEIINEDDKFSPLIFKLKAIKKRPIDKLNNIFYLNPDLFKLFDSYKSLNISKRYIPINIGYPSLYEHRYRIITDTSLKIDSVVIPESDSTDFEFCYFKTEYSASEDELVVRLIKADIDYEIPVDKFDQFERFRKAQNRIGSKYIKLYSH